MSSGEANWREPGNSRTNPDAWWLSAFAASQLFGVTPHDSTTFAVVIAVISAASALATYGPVRRATKVDPAEALRVE